MKTSQISVQAIASRLRAAIGVDPRGLDDRRVRQQRDARRRTDAQSPGSRARNFALRVASAAVLAPAVLVLTYIGGWPFLAVCFLGAVGILYEWTLLVARRPAPGIRDRDGCGRGGAFLSQGIR